MFKSLTNISYDEEKDIFKYELIDDDFTEFFYSRKDEDGGSMGEEGFIKIYKDKNLNVPLNLIYLFIELEKMTLLPIQTQMKWNLKHNKNYPPYHKEVEKYLLLI